MKTPHLAPALPAILILVAVLIGGAFYTQSVAQRDIHALASSKLSLNITGSVLQKIAIQQPDLLLIYGSSEMIYQSNTYGASEVFSNYPTGFAPFVVAYNGMTSLITAQDVASLGPDLHGKKVVISFTPSMFHALMADKTAYVGLFSRLHANELAFSPDLSLETKQLAAQRMRQYPKTLKNDPVLNFALEKLADDSLPNRALYYAIWPLGKLQTTVLELQDHWETLQTIEAQHSLDPAISRKPAAIDWSALEIKVTEEQKARTDNNPYGIDNAFWGGLRDRFQQKAEAKEGQSFIGNMALSAEWTDLDILLRTLTELGARPLLLSRPINGSYWEALGVTEQARQTTYYARLQQLAQRYNAPIVDFQDHDNDKYFNVDPSSHTSSLGWVYVDQTLDAFYHDLLH